jgi:hypothetical protein
VQRHWSEATIPRDVHIQRNAKQRVVHLFNSLEPFIHSFEARDQLLFRVRCAQESGSQRIGIVGVQRGSCFLRGRGSFSRCHFLTRDACVRVCMVCAACVSVYVVLRSVSRNKFEFELPLQFQVCCETARPHRLASMPMAANLSTSAQWRVHYHKCHTHSARNV